MSPAGTARYAPDDWRSHIRGSSVNAAGTVYRHEQTGQIRPIRSVEPAPAAVATGPSLPDKIARVAVIALLCALLVFGFLYGPQISEWFNS